MFHGRTLDYKLVVLLLVDFLVSCSCLLVTEAARTGGIDGKEESLPYLLIFLLFNINNTRVPEELWMEVCDIVQEAVIKTIPKKKKCKKAKWLSEFALQTAEKRRETKSRGEKERYTHLNAEFQRIARRDKKAFLRDQCKEIEENNRMGKTRDLFKKIQDTKGTFHAKVGTIKEEMVWT